MCYRRVLQTAFQILMSEIFVVEVRVFSGESNGIIGFIIVPIVMKKSPLFLP